MKVVKSLDIVNDYIEKLEQENKELQKQLDFMIERNDDKQQRIDKAIEYINHYIKELDILDLNELLQILGEKE